MVIVKEIKKWQKKLFLVDRLSSIKIDSFSHNTQRVRAHFKCFMLFMSLRFFYLYLKYKRKRFFKSLLKVEKMM